MVQVLQENIVCLLINNASLLFMWGSSKDKTFFLKKIRELTDLFANHDTGHSNYISIFPLFCLKPVKKWKVKYDWTAYFANNESFCTKPNNMGLAESIHFAAYIM